MNIIVYTQNSNMKKEILCFIEVEEVSLCQEYLTLYLSSIEEEVVSFPKHKFTNLYYKEVITKK